jgi:transcriptional regulator with XRE-family HTH domain
LAVCQLELANSIVEVLAETVGAVMDRVQKAFIANIRRIRREAGLSQMKMAELCNLSTSFIAEIETGKKFPSSVSIERIATALSLRPYQLFLEDQDRREVDATARITKLTRELKASVSATIDETARKISAELSR